jgi:hypothetical protein
MTPAMAYWKKRHALAACNDRIQQLHAAFNSPQSMTRGQFGQILAFTLEYQPDLIVELGRGDGNSTCLFTEAANQLGPETCRVVSLCRSKSWQPEPPPAIAAVVPREWFAPLTTFSGDILDFDYASLLHGGKRVLLFWDAHGYDIAECVLGVVMPLLVTREHYVLMHDLSDTRYLGPDHRAYGNNRLWRANDVSGRAVWLGNIYSPFEQAVAILDFATRNNLTLHSADESMRSELVADKPRRDEMLALLGENLYSHRAQWFYWTMCERLGPFTFPRFPTPEERSAR